MSNKKQNENEPTTPKKNMTDISVDTCERIASAGGKNRTLFWVFIVLILAAAVATLFVVIFKNNGGVAGGRIEVNVPEAADVEPPVVNIFNNVMDEDGNPINFEEE